MIPQEPVWGLAADDWNILFDAVQARLKLAVAQSPANALQAVVLDCIMALDYLHAALKEERKKHRNDVRSQSVQPPPVPGLARDAEDPC